MSISKVIKRIFFYPIGICKGLHAIGKNGSRDYYNRLRFKKSIIDEGCSIDENSIIEADSHILANTIINGSHVHSYSYIGRNSIVQNATVGKFCSIANDVFIGLGKHPIANFSMAPIFYKKNNILNIKLVENDLDFIEYEKTFIGHDVWIGARAIILDGVSIGNGAVVAANAVVTKNIPPYAIVAGVPAKIVKYRFPEEKIKMLIDSMWWDESITEIKDRSVKYNK